MPVKRSLATVLRRLLSTKYKPFVFLALAFVSCNKGLNPEAPVESYVSNSTNSREISYINIPLEINLRDIEYQINQNLNSTLYSDESFDDNGGDDLKITILKTGNFGIANSLNDVFTFEIPLKIDATKRISVLGFKQAASTIFEMKIKFSSQFYLGADWAVHTLTESKGFEFITDPKVSIAGFNVPMKSIIAKVIENYQPYISRQIDEQITENIVIKPQILSAWNEIKKPIEVSKEYHTWVSVDPQDMLITPLKTKGNLISTNVVMKAYVDTFTGKPKATDLKVSTDLPPLKFVNDAPAGFNVTISNLLSFEEAEAIAKSQFLGSEFSFKDGKYNTKVEGLRLYGSDNNQLVIQVNLSGSLNGVVFMKGYPVYNTSKKTIEIENLDFDIKTKSLLLKSASWLLEGKLKREINQVMNYPVEGLLNTIGENIEQALNEEYIKGVKINSNIMRMVPKSIALSKEGFVSSFSAVGTINLKVDGISKLN